MRFTKNENQYLQIEQQLNAWTEKPDGIKRLLVITETDFRGDTMKVINAHLTTGNPELIEFIEFAYANFEIGDTIDLNDLECEYYLNLRLVA